MDSFVDERDYKLLESDKYTFFVMRKIMGGPLELLLSDHKRLIICYTGHPYPVWIWTPDDAAEDELEQAYQLAKENGLLDGKHSFNIKYDLATYFMEQAAKEGIDSPAVEKCISLLEKSGCIKDAAEEGRKVISENLAFFNSDLISELFSSMIPKDFR